MIDPRPRRNWFWAMEQAERGAPTRRKSWPPWKRCLVVYDGTISLSVTSIHHSDKLTVEDIRAMDWELAKKA